MLSSSSVSNPSQVTRAPSSSGWWRIGAALLVLLGGGWLLSMPVSCGPPDPTSDASEGSAPDQGPERCFDRGPGQPVIQAVGFIGQDRRNRRILLMRIEYQDLERDLQGGRYHFWADGVQQTSQPIPTLREPSSIEGLVVLPLDLSALDFEKGQEVEIELQIEDAQGNLSNQPLVVLRVLL